MGKKKTKLGKKSLNSDISAGKNPQIPQARILQPSDEGVVDSVDRDNSELRNSQFEMSDGIELRVNASEDEFIDSDSDADSDEL